MQSYLLSLIAAGIAACIVHEGGHYLAALAFGKHIKFRFEWGWLFGVIPIPRGVWTMPYMASWKQRIVALAGFGTELACAGAAMAFLRWPYLLLVASIHLIAYPFYAGEASDFKWL